MGVIAWIVLGLAVGLIADKIMHSPHGVVITTLIGIGGTVALLAVVDLVSGRRGVRSSRRRSLRR
jgi:uncharacterized membrane protein YeaQ/YmgE (transglycosylase-associated protein family)